MIHLDTNFLIRSLWPNTPEDRLLRGWVDGRMPIAISAVAWAEFLCGPVNPRDVFVARSIVGEPEPLMTDDAVVAAKFYNVAGRRRGHLLDCMIAAVCVRKGAQLATANVDDFRALESEGLRMIG